MKRIFRILGGISMTFGALLLICGIYSILRSFFSNDIENRLIFVVSMLAMAAIGGGLLYLGYQPYRQSRGKIETVTSGLSHQKPTPPKSSKLTSEEIKRQELEQEERTRRWKEAEEERSS